MCLSVRYEGLHNVSVPTWTIQPTVVEYLLYAVPGANPLDGRVLQRRWHVRLRVRQRQTATSRTRLEPRACAPAVYVDNGTSCQCPSNQKDCGGVCVSTLTPDNGCSGVSCDPCPLPSHAMATDCSGAGNTCGFICDTANGYVLKHRRRRLRVQRWVDRLRHVLWMPGRRKDVWWELREHHLAAHRLRQCLVRPFAPNPTTPVPTAAAPEVPATFVCDSTGHWSKNGSACVCESGWKDCGGTACVDATSPQNGCAEASCNACTLPEHAVSTECNGTGGTCSFTCDATGHWVAIGDACVCNSGWKDCGGTSCVDTHVACQRGALKPRAVHVPCPTTQRPATATAQVVPATSSATRRDTGSSPVTSVCVTRATYEEGGVCVPAWPRLDLWLELLLVRVELGNMGCS